MFPGRSDGIINRFAFRPNAARGNWILVEIASWKGHDKEMRLLISFLFLLTFGSAASAGWDLNDVSYLMPLPADIQDNNLLKIDTSGKGGPLLPEHLVNKIPVLSFQQDRAESNRLMRALAVRIDPCFPLPTPQSCQAQIRLVWQPLELSPRGQVQTIDAALHSFYVLTEGEFKSLLGDLQEWKKKNPVNTRGLPLQVHPAWREGADSPSLVEFLSVIKKYIGQANLTRITAMVLRGNADMWAFAGFEVRENSVVMFPVARLGDRLSQAFVNLAVPADHFAGGGISPQPKGADTLNKITAESILVETGEEETVISEAQAAYRAENPHRFTPESMDCVSCHVARPALQWVLNKRPELKVDQIWNDEVYRNAKYDLDNVSPQFWSTQNIRAFGYFGKDIAISQRVINESAEVADLVRAFVSVK